MKAFALALLVLLGGCSLFRRTPVPVLRQDVRATIGQPYRLGPIGGYAQVWRYPRTEYGVDTTGLATIAADHTGNTADGEIFDQTVLAAGHQSLQLPAIVRVTNLENGRQVVLRLNDRGPATPARLLVLTKRAAALLDITRDGTRIRMQMEDAETRQLAAGTTSDTPALDVAPAPRGAIATETLSAPTGAAQSQRVRVGATRTVAPATDAAPSAAIPLRLPEVVTQGRPNPGQLYIDAGSFGRQDYAAILANRLAPLGARLTTSYNAPRDRAYRIRIGPFSSVPQAEAMLERTIREGVGDAGIVVE